MKDLTIHTPINDFMTINYPSNVHYCVTNAINDVWRERNSLQVGVYSDLKNSEFESLFNDCLPCSAIDLIKKQELYENFVLYFYAKFVFLKNWVINSFTFEEFKKEYILGGVE